MNQEYMDLVKQLETSESPKEILKDLMTEWFKYLEKRMPPEHPPGTPPEIIAAGTPYLLASRGFAKIIHNIGMQFLGWMTSGDPRGQSYMNALQTMFVACRDAEFFWAGASREDVLRQMGVSEQSPNSDGEVELIIPGQEAKSEEGLVSPE